MYFAVETEKAEKYVKCDIYDIKSPSLTFCNTGTRTGKLDKWKARTVCDAPMKFECYVRIQSRAIQVFF